MTMEASKTKVTRKRTWPTQVAIIVHLLTLELEAMGIHLLNLAVRIPRVIALPARPRIMAELPVLRMAMGIMEQQVILRHIPAVHTLKPILTVENTRVEMGVMETTVRKL